MAKTRKKQHSNGETAAGATVAGAEVPAKPKKRRRKSVPRESPSQRSSVYRGVTRHRYTGQFEARLWDKNSWKQVYLGAYDDEEAAAQAYDLAALKTWGPDTILNFPAVLPEVAASAGPSSSRQVPADGAVVLPSKSPPASVASSAGCTPYAVAPAARPNVTVDIDAFSSKRRTLLADADSSVIFAAMEELHDNGFYKFRDDDELEQMEDLGLHESLQQCVPRSEAPKDEPCSNPTAAATGEEAREPGPSTKRPPKVPPLVDDEVSKFECGICLETLDVLDLFHGMPCEHKYCAACITKYVELKIREGYLDIPCPDPACKDILHPEKCKKVIDFAAFSDWGMRLAESAIPPSRRAYCPNRRCGIMLETSGEERPAMAPCPACDHLLCASCGLEYWSVDGSGKHDCDKGPDAELVRKLAEALKWKKCSKCEMTIERVDGCRRITCRCHLVFCYLCGLPILRSQVGEGGEVCRCNDTFDVDDVDMDHPLDADMPQQDDDHLDT